MINYNIYVLKDPRTLEIRYVGMTFNSLKVRLKAHCFEKGKSHKLSWIKSLKNLELKPIIESIEEGSSTYEVVCEREVFWISELSKFNKLTNSTTGGDKNKIMSDDVRHRMSLSKKEYYKTHKFKHTEESKKKLSKASKNRFKDPNEIKKLKISNKLYEDSKTNEQKLNDILKQSHQVIIQYDTQMNLIMEFISLRDAERKTGLNRRNISKCCQHKVNTVGGFIWRFKNDKTLALANKNNKVIIQYSLRGELIKEWESTSVASKALRINNNVISSVLRGKGKSAGGFIWKYK